MIDAAEVFEAYLEGVARLAGADSATLFVPPSTGGSVEATICHVGSAAPLPELADLDAARRFAARDRTPAAGPGAGIDGIIQSAVPAGRLIPVPAPAAPHGGVVGRRRTDREPGAPVAWLGLRLVDPAPAEPSVAGLRQAIESSGGIASDAIGGWMLALGGAVAAYHLRLAGLIGDSVVGLPGRAELQSFLAEEISTARSRSRELALYFINPDDFGRVNERFGREAGDRVMREIAERLLVMRRRGDLVARYGGAIFASVLVNTAAAHAGDLGERFRTGLTERPYLDGAVRLGFSVGVACFEPEDGGLRDALDLARRADQALSAAKRGGGGIVTTWSADSEIEETENLDRLTGVFTGNMAKDYRNMELLWNVLGAITAGTRPESLADGFLSILFTTIKPERAVLLTATDDSPPRPVAVACRDRASGQASRDLGDFELVDDAVDLVLQALADGAPAHRPVAAGRGARARSAWAFPLLLDERPIGCLYLDGSPGDLDLDGSDQVFLTALASQLALALDRARLAELERSRQDGERRRLQAELNDLRNAIQQARIIFRSGAMENLLATVRRVAATEATVLLTGESGTGKDLLARTLHELSPRRDRPLVVVDCSSIAPSLIESELFGHEKGAYTGAQRRSQGRLAQANGGTVVLDEVSELPHEVQSRLLRFVQEKELISVGATRSQRLDVRIVAATNRNLEAEVAAGRFREDLYYRLNVVRLSVPPLRERPEDVPLLARHFLETFALTYQKPVHRLTPEADRLLQRYRWPGNVRELENRILQAVVLCDGDELGVDHLGRLAAAVDPPTGWMDGADRRPRALPAAEPPATAARPARVADAGWSALRSLLGDRIDAAVANDGVPTPPLGTWLAEDLVLAAHAASGGVVRRAADRVGIAETTFGRRLRQARARSASGMSSRPAAWEPVRQALADLVAADADGQDFLRRSEGILLEEILERLPGDVATGSALLGVTPPTFRRRVAAQAAGT